LTQSHELAKGLATEEFQEINHLKWQNDCSENGSTTLGRFSGLLGKFFQ